ncbi:MAG: ABC transporter ATP-binding protein [Phycisphaerales bacterium]|jgi:ATP-binding cassette subfamily B protein|nr:ABC transporter ATP-binding protein [Phycisphaerales bacterium]
MGSSTNDNFGTKSSEEDILPEGLRGRVNGELAGQSVVAWSAFDLDQHNKYHEQHVVLTEQKLVVLDESAAQSFDVSRIDEAKIVEGLGVDRLLVVAGGEVALDLHYTRRNRRGMVRLHRKLERRLPGKAATERPPEWLEAAERQAERGEICEKCGQQIPAYAEGVCPQCLHKRRILWRLMDIARPYRMRIWVALFFTLCATALQVVPGPLNKRMIDQALAPNMTLTGHQRWMNLLLWGGLMIAAVIGAEIINGIRLRILAMVGTSVTGDLRHSVYAHLHELSLRFFAKRRTGSLITRVTNDTDRLWDFIVFGSVNLIRDVMLIVLIAMVMFWMNWKLALVALVPLPPLAWLTYWRGMTMQRMFGRLWTYWSRMTAVVGDALPGVRVVKAFANERREISRFDRRSDEFTEKEQEVNKVWTQLQPLISGMMRLGGMFVWIVGGWWLIHYPGDDNTLGTLVAFNFYLWLFYQPLMELANSNRMVTRAATSAQRVFEVLDMPPEIYSRAGAITKDRLEGEVEFKQVSFSYEGAQPALREVSMSARTGEMIGLCGPSGAGKSTFVNLICRFYDATDGQILIDGVDVRDYDIQWLRRQIGVVLQEPYLFHGTVADNIRYGNADASEGQVIASARAANAHDFIVGFPDGYDTMVGERGQSLSGGERQRISIARAILHNPRILILDEATSSVDSETEKQIQEALDRLVEGRTTFAIAHRLSTLQAADRLIVLEHGRIVEQGTHAELVNRENGVYARLHRTQVELNATVAIR